VQQIKRTNTHACTCEERISLPYLVCCPINVLTSLLDLIQALMGENHCHWRIVLLCVPFLLKRMLNAKRYGDNPRYLSILYVHLSCLVSWVQLQQPTSRGNGGSSKKAMLYLQNPLACYLCMQAIHHPLTVAKPRWSLWVHNAPTKIWKTNTKIKISPWF